MEQDPSDHDDPLIVPASQGSADEAPRLPIVRRAIPGQLPLLCGIDSERREREVSSRATTAVAPTSTESATPGEPAAFPDAGEDLQDRTGAVAEQQLATWPATVSVRLPVAAGAIFHPSALEAARREVLQGRSPVEYTDRARPDLVSFYFGVEAPSRLEAEATVHGLGLMLVERLCGLAYEAELESSPLDRTTVPRSRLAPPPRFRIVGRPAQGRRRDVTSGDHPRP